MLLLANRIAFIVKTQNFSYSALISAIRRQRQKDVCEPVEDSLVYTETGQPGL